MTQIMQGDAYCVPIHIVMDGSEITPVLAETVEITIGDLRKLYPGDVSFDETAEDWLMPLTQEETFALSSCKQPVQVRVKFSGGDVVGVNGGFLDVNKCFSKEML